MMALIFTLNIKGFTFILDNAFRALGNLATGLKEQLLDKEMGILLLNKFFDPSTPSIRIGRDGEWKNKEKKINNDVL